MSSVPEDKTVTTEDDDVNRLFECCICHQDLQDAHICPRCSQLFCRKCIDEWLGKEANCPCCRQGLSTAALVKARTFDQMQQVVHRLVTNESRNRCSEHRKEQLSFFCFPCETCVCAVCLFSELHVEHKDQAVLLEVAYGQYGDKLNSTLKSLDERNESLDKSFKQVEINQNLLTAKLDEQKAHLEQLEKDRARTVELHGCGEKLMTDEKDATTLVKIMEMLRISELFLAEKKHQVTQIDVVDRKNLLPEPTKLKFHLERFNETIAKHGFYESSPLTKDGFSWRLQLIPTTAKEIYALSLQLQEGPPGEYTVIRSDKQSEELIQFDLYKYKLIDEHCKADVAEDQDTCEIEICIQQARSHEERCVQLENYIKRLEAKNSENELFMRYLAEYQSKVGSI